MDDLADEVLPLGGPYTPDALAAAAGLTAELVHRLNHATFPGTAGLPYPASVNTLVSSLSAAVHGLPQLLRQLSDRLAQFSGHPDVYADWVAKGEPAEVVIARAVGSLREAGAHASAMGEALSAAQNHTARLGFHDDDEGQGWP